MGINDNLKHQNFIAYQRLRLNQYFAANAGVLRVTDAPSLSYESRLHKHPQTPVSDSLIAAIEVVVSALLNLELRLHTGPPGELVLKCFDSNFLVFFF